MPIICNNCGQNLPDDSVFCPKCGTKVTIIRCTGCGAVLAADARFCPSCGTPAGNSEVPAKPDTRMEQTPQAVEVQEAPAVPQTAPDKVEQRSSGQTTLADAPKQAPHHFDWKYWGVSILRGYGTTRNSVEVTDENVVLTSKLNKRAIYDATAVPLKDIASVEVWEKVSVISALMVAILVGGFIGLVALIPFGVTAIDPGSAEGIGSMLGIIILLAIVIFAALFRIHHWRITIKTHKEPQYRIYELSAKPQDHETLFQLQKSILDQAGAQGEPVRKKSNKLVPTFVVSIIAVLAIVAAMILSHPELFETKQANDTGDKDPIQAVENEPTAQPQDEVAIAPPDPKHWIYDPYNILSSDTGALLNVQDFLWDQKYQSVVALAVIKDSLEHENLDDYAVKLKNDWGLRKDDMLCLIYNNGESCHWLPNQVFFDYYNTDYYNGLQEILDIGYQADSEGDYESALKNFYEYLDYCYAEVYDNNIEASVSSEMAEKYLGTWENVSDSSCVIEVSPQPVDGYFAIEISWWVGTQYCINWTYAGLYNDDTGGIDCYHGSRSDFTKDGMTPFTEDIYTDIGEAELSLLSDDYLEWINFSEDMESDFPEILFNFQRVTTQ